MRMNESYVGEDPFRDGIRHYLRKHAYDNGTGEDLWTSIEEVSRHPVKRSMEAWIQKKGYLLVTVTKKGDKLHLQQEQFFLSEENSGERWPIPLTIQRIATSESLLYQDKDLEIDAAGFLKLNVGQTGFYRVGYDEETLKNILSNLKALSPLDRWGIVYDLHAFLISGRISLVKDLDHMNTFHSDSNRKELQNVFVGSGTTSRTLERMIPLLGIGRENHVLEGVQKLSSPDTEKGIKKGMEFLQIYCKFVKTYAPLLQMSSLLPFPPGRA